MPRRKVTSEKLAAVARKRVAVEGPSTYLPPVEEAPAVAVAMNVDTLKVGCAIIQAAMGGTVLGPDFQTLFPTETWTVAPSGVAVYRTPIYLLGALSNKVRIANGLRPLPIEISTDIVTRYRNRLTKG